MKLKYIQTSNNFLVKKLIEFGIREQKEAFRMLMNIFLF